MRKLLLSAAIAVFGFTAMNAQEVKFGAKAGVNFATIGGDSENVDSRTSFHLGGVAEIVISDKFSVQPELLFSSQGAKSEYSEDLGELGSFKVEENLKLNYLNLPIIAKYYVTDGLSIEAGPQLGFLLSADYDVEVDGESDEQDVKDNFKSIDFGAGFGLGYKLENGLNFNLRYNLGLSNISDTDGDFSIQNNVFQISVGYMF